jgi:hypothetical protein
MTRPKKNFLIYVFILLVLCISLALASQTQQQIKQIKKIPPKALALVKPKIILERVPLESPQSMKIYDVQTVEIRPDLIQKFTKEKELVLKTIAPTVKVPEEIYTDKEKKFTRLLMDTQRGHIILLPHIEKLAMVKAQLLTKEAALNRAQDYVNTLQIIPKDSTKIIAKHVVTLSKAEIKQGQQPVISNILQTVIFQRTLDEKPVMGNGSQLFLDLGNQGQLEGVERTWNKVVPSAIKPEFRSDNEVYNEIETILNQQIQGNVTVQVKKPRLIYSGDDRKYVQPAYFFSAEISSPNAVAKAYFAGLVTALKNPPEAVVLFRNAQMRTLPQPAKTSTGPSSSLASAENDPSVGRYVVRNDSWDWVDDAVDFVSGLSEGHTSSLPAITLGDYYWDEPRVWTTEETYFVDKWHIALMEGHGDNWLFTTTGNCCDAVNLNSATQPGYGDNSMRFLILKGCSIIPAPPDRANWPDPWWRIFKGLHQAVGFRTSMYINDNISKHFGKHLGQNSRVLDSWFHATNKCSSYQWERFWGSWGDEVYGYGCVIMIPGHEGDGIYDTGTAPTATSTGLTVWWQY